MSGGESNGEPTRETGPAINWEAENTLYCIQRQLRYWQEHNFPGRPAWQPLLGIQEETGELSHAFLKAVQNIRGTAEQHIEAKMDAVGDILIFLIDYCNAETQETRVVFDLEIIARKTWEQVRTRNWRPEKGHLPAGVWA